MIVKLLFLTVLDCFIITSHLHSKIILMFKTNTYLHYFLREELPSFVVQKIRIEIMKSWRLNYQMNTIWSCKMFNIRRNWDKSYPCLYPSFIGYSIRITHNYTELHTYILRLTHHHDFIYRSSQIWIFEHDYRP